MIRAKRTEMRLRNHTEAGHERAPKLITSVWSWHFTKESINSTAGGPLQLGWDGGLVLDTPDRADLGLALKSLTWAHDQTAGGR